MVPQLQPGQDRGRLRLANAPRYSSPYLHLLDGRMRIKIPELKGRRGLASRVEKALYGMDGISHVKANPTTSNVLILFESHAINPDRILEAIGGLDFLKNSRSEAQLTRKVTAPSVARVLAQRAAKGLGKQLLLFGIQVAVEQATLGLVRGKRWKLL